MPRFLWNQVCPQITGCIKQWESSLDLQNLHAASFREDQTEPGYWKLTVYALGYNDYTYSFQATAENIVNPTMEPTDFTSLKTEVEAAKALAEADYTMQLEVLCR